jgi:hypothetical protein
VTGARAWLAVATGRPHDADACAAVRDAATGAPCGWLAVWARQDRPGPGALRADPAAFDAGGPPALVSLVLVPEGRTVPFDDAAVQRARQLVLAAGGSWAVVTTLVDDSVHFRGSLLAARGELPDDPFALVAPARRLEVGSGLLASGPARLPAPVIERWAGKPWPQSGF